MAAPTNNDLLNLLNTIRGEMATKTDIARLHWENATLRAENEAQTSQLRCLRTDVVNLRAEVEDLRTKILFELWDGFGDTREDVLKCSQQTSRRVSDEANEIKSKMEDVEDGVRKLTMKDERRDEEAQEVNDDFLRVINRMERVEGKVDMLADEFEESEASRKDSGISFAEEENQDQKQKKKTAGLWFANGY